MRETTGCCNLTFERVELSSKDLEEGVPLLQSNWPLTGSFCAVFSVVTDIAVKYCHVLRSKKKRQDLGHALCIYWRRWKDFRLFIVYLAVKCCIVVQ